MISPALVFHSHTASALAVGQASSEVATATKAISGGFLKWIM
jgi:hypothetical protein